LEEGLDLEIDRISDVGGGAWTKDGSQVKVGTNYNRPPWEPKGSRYLTFEFRHGEGQIADQWRVNVDERNLVGNPEEGFLLYRGDLVGFRVPEFASTTTLAFRKIDERSKRRVAYFPMFGRGTRNGITYDGPGFGTRLVSFDPGSLPKVVTFDLTRDFEGFFVWITPEFSDGSMVPAGHALSKPSFIKATNRCRYATTQFGGSKVAGWHVFAAPCVEFRVTGVATVPKDRVTTPLP
jgi:hypothetical protein